ncbi:MAG TPA: ribose ABC transporter permease [Candidatus Angelobacter sp.]|nr:ribose ABC transporter permease [Candidatus Angelobacter sp.]
MSANTKEWIKKLQPLIALAVMVFALSLLSSNFLTLSNQRNILLQISVNLCLSIGMTLVMLTGGIDLSVGSIFAMGGAVAAGLLKNGLALKPLGVVLQFTPLGAVVGGILVGFALGLFNGVVITRLRLQPFIVTLGMLSIARGLTMLWTGGFPITDLGPSFDFIGVGSWLGIPMPVWITAALVVIFHFISRCTLLGRYIYAVGGSEKAAGFSGLNVDRVKLWVYALGGALAAVAGLTLTARLDAADPKAGLGYELDSIAAVVIGGTSLLGGRGSILGTVLGCLIIGVLNNGMFLLDISPFWQLVVKGLVIIAAAAIDKMGSDRE